MLLMVASLGLIRIFGRLWTTILNSTSVSTLVWHQSLQWNSVLRGNMKGSKTSKLLWMSVVALGKPLKPSFPLIPTFVGSTMIFLVSLLTHPPYLVTEISFVHLTAKESYDFWIFCCNISTRIDEEMYSLNGWIDNYVSSSTKVHRLCVIRNWACGWKHVWKCTKWWCDLHEGKMKKFILQKSKFQWKEISFLGMLYIACCCENL